MDSKFYVSLEAARLLKEKGYNEECDYYYSEVLDCLVFSECTTNEKLDCSRVNRCSAPTILEALEWLDEQGVHVACMRWSGLNKFTYAIHKTHDHGGGGIFCNNQFDSRSSAFNAGIIKALELL